MPKNDIVVIFYTSASHHHLAGPMATRLREAGLKFNWYTDAWLREQFPAWCAQYDYILRCKRGGGYWIWKPKIILHALENLGKRVLYLDASVGWDGDIHQQIDAMGDWFTVRSGYAQADWTKRDCFTLMACDEEKYWSAKQLWAGCVLVDTTKEWLLKLWLSYCENPNIIMDIPNVCGKPNFPNFREHRHDQSILTNLVVAHHLPSYETTFFRDV